MDKDYSAPNFLGESSGVNDENSSGMVDYMLCRNLEQPMPQLPSSGFGGTPSFDKMSFADVMQFADFGPKLALRNHDNQETGIDPVYFLKFPVLNEKIEDHSQTQHIMSTSQQGADYQGNIGNVFLEEKADQDDENDNNSVQLRFIGGGGEEEEEDRENKKEVKSKRKRARTSKTSEEVESQRMTHIAVERNRRKQMNEHLRVLRSLMPGSYVQRGDQASIIGGAIEFVRELEQLLQCLESQKRRRILGETGTRQIGDTSSSSPITAVSNQAQPLIISGSVTELEGGGGGLREEMAENKSCLADVEVKLLGFDAMIKILSRRRPGQLIKTIAALEDLHLSILHTNITTMEQTVLYSFNVKVDKELHVNKSQILATKQENIRSIERRCLMLDQKITAQELKITMLRSTIEDLDSKYHCFVHQLRTLKVEVEELKELEEERDKYYKLKCSETNKFFKMSRSSDQRRVFKLSI